MALLLLTIVPSAAAAPPNPAVEQYVESVPRAGGDAPRGSDRGSATRKLPAPVRRRIEAEGGADAQALEAVGGSPALGAPAPTDARRDRAREAGRADDRQSPLSAAVGAPAHGETDAVWPFLAGVLAITAVLGAVAIVRRGRTRSR